MSHIGGAKCPTSLPSVCPYRLISVGRAGGSDVGHLVPPMWDNLCPIGKRAAASGGGAEQPDKKPLKNKSAQSQELKDKMLEMARNIHGMQNLDELTNGLVEISRDPLHAFNTAVQALTNDDRLELVRLAGVSGNAGWKMSKVAEVLFAGIIRGLDVKKDHMETSREALTKAL